MRASLACLTTFLAFALFFALSLVVIGIWALADESTPIYASRVFSEGRVEIVGLSMSLISPIVFGLLTIVPFSVMLYALIVKDVEWDKFLAAYIIILMIMLLFEIPVSIIPMAYLSSQTGTDLKTGLTKSLNLDYRGLPNSWTDSHTKSLLWEKLMIRQSCCGINGINDFTASYGLYASTWYTAFRSYTLSNGTVYTGSQVKIPMSCCTLKNTLVILNNDWLNMRNYLTSELCPLDIRFSTHSNGCYTAAYNYITAYTIAVLCVMMTHVLCLAISFVFALYLLCQVLDGDSEVYYARRHHSSRVSPGIKNPIATRRPAETRTYNREPYTPGR